MLWVGLSGGIGSGKSTVAARLAGHGALVVDADRVAREVVEPGMPALVEISDRFGPQVVGPDGALDRAALGQVVFADGSARRDLEAITHPRIAERTREIVSAAPGDAVVVHDIPLLVELDRSADYALTVVVDVGARERLRRLVELRGMDPEHAQSRIGAQATDDQRAAAADVLLDNGGTLEQLHAAVDRLWDGRLVPFEENLRRGWSSWGDAPDGGAPTENGPCRARAERSLSRIRGAVAPGAEVAGEITALRCAPDGGGRCELLLPLLRTPVLEDPVTVRRLGRVGFVVEQRIVLGADPRWQVRCRLVEGLPDQER